MIINNELNYTRERVLSKDKLGQEAIQVLNWVGENKRVLEIGCHTGNLSEWLTKQGCMVTGVDINADAIQIAQQYMGKAIVADLEKEDFWQQLEGIHFDVITIMHVLEHLTNPWDTLKRLTVLLKPEGEIIIGLPNINNARDRFQIFFGEFNYTQIGVMDKTHLRFFNQKTARELINSSGLSVVTYSSPRQVNPIHYFLDYVPFLWRFRKLFSSNNIPIFFKNKSNLTDVVMNFRCKLN